MESEDPQRKCDKCKIIKPRSLFYRYKYCKKCHIIDYLKIHLRNAITANELNLSIDELNNIMKNDINDSTRNPIGEHERYDEIMSHYLNNRNETIINNIINQLF